MSCAALQRHRLPQWSLGAVCGVRQGSGVEPRSVDQTLVGSKRPAEEYIFDRPSGVTKVRCALLENGVKKFNSWLPK